MLTRKKIEKFYEDLDRLGLEHPVADIANETGFGKPQVSAYLKYGTDPGKGKKPSENFIDTFYEKFNNSLQNIPHETADSSPKNLVNESEAEYKNGGDKEKYNARSIYNLTESNRVIAESNASLARSHEELVAMLKNSIVYARPKITVDDASTRTDFLELIARIGTGEKIWNSRAEADAALSKFVLVPNMGDTKEDTHAGSGKGHKNVGS
jgi:hypothetical protein